ncbi:Anaerobic nitric oxide reductase transcription regulator NorR [Neobacillus rhizosphaerae]|uniref:HTH-type transcriptional regulatory protein TyrR n=1 Tax=Neobacillus rhizosphaerae TaxID=2880965 RepID=A0ABM9ERA6_9BACI|nr:sigma 54-interacting transcriptional regulator [Neobacillus rhizosphaerae]CAH2715176.1 Anaerobic nitric oxide reductase transcription regulator NorR [Neobacillus rhizosphaerae]
MDNGKYHIRNAVYIPWSTTIETILLKALELDCQWFILQENEKTIGYINRSTLYKKVKDIGFEKALSLPLEELMMKPILNNDGDISSSEKTINASILKREFEKIESVIDWNIGERISNHIASDKWILKELETIFYNFFHNILITDGYGNITFATAEDDQQYLGKNVFDLERQKEFYPSVTAKVLSTGKREQGLQYTKSGEVFEIESVPIKDNIGRIVRVISITKDSSEVTELTEKLNEVKNLLTSYQQEVISIQQEHSNKKPFIYASKEMENLNNLIKSVASFDTTVLILGETGVGKEVVAHTIHRLSNRYDKPFIAVNCGAIPENLMESELFGYEEGSFSGARKGGKTGVFELANNGTVFLDEIGEMPLHLQVKLLRVLQEKKVKRIGGLQEKPIDMRIIAATNQDLAKKVKEKTFREDLYYRLNVVPINIPPLRERKEDIEALIFYYLEFFNQKYNKNIEINELMLERLKKYSWPGNVRELQNVMERLAITGQDDSFTVNQPLSLLANEVVMSANRKFPQLFDFLEKAEQQILVEAKTKSKNTRDMANLLGVNQSTIVRKLKKYNL